MDDDAILTFRAPAHEAGRVVAAAAPVLELAYAAYTVAQRGVPPAPGPAPRPGCGGWRRRRPSRCTRWPASGGSAAWTASASRRSSSSRTSGTPATTTRSGSSATCRSASWASGPHRTRSTTPSCWRACGRAWSGSATRPRRWPGAPPTAAFRDGYRTQGSVLAVPLGLGVAGGFYFESGGALLIGYGLQVERVHERTAERVTTLAARMRVFADPTRALLLTLIGRFAGLRLTVGDLALQLGVSQPSVSGHLRQLREAGLVHLERRGTKAFHRLDVDAVHRLLTDFEAAVVGRDGEDDDAMASARADATLTPSALLHPLSIGGRRCTGPPPCSAA